MQFFFIRDRIIIKGGYAGLSADPNDPTKPDNQDDRDVDLFVSILSGDIGTLGDDSDNSYHVVAAWNVGNATVLDGFTITGGMANASAPDPNTPPLPPDHGNKGGGMYLLNSHMNIVNCTFTGNTADPESESRGGAVAVTGGRPGENLATDFINCTFTNNIASRGGAIAVLGDIWEAGNPRPAPPLATDVILTNCLIANNQALKPTNGGSQATGSGGGLFLFHQVAFGMTGCTISENTAEEIGAAMLMECIEQPNDSNPDLNTFVVMQNSIVWENHDKVSSTDAQIEDSGDVNCPSIPALGINSNLQGGFMDNDIDPASANLTALAPEFVAPSIGDFRLQE